MFIIPMTCAGRAGCEAGVPRRVAAWLGTGGESHRGLHGLDGVVLVVHGRGGARHVVDLVDLDEELLRHVAPDDLEVRLVEQVLDVGLLRGEEVIESDHVMPLVYQPSAEVRAQEAAATRDEDSQERVLSLRV